MSVPDLPLMAAERPRCSRCLTRMMLVRISPGPAGYDLRTFECPKCDQVTRKLIASDPMKADGANRWLAGELKPPR
jgi:hypothetical protein